MRKVAVAVAVGLAVLGAALLVRPFDRSTAGGTFSYGAGFSTHCTSPIVGAWRADRDAGGWFGYAPLTSTPRALPTCQGAARHRVAWGSAFLAAALLLGVVLRRRSVDVEGRAGSGVE